MEMHEYPETVTSSVNALVAALGERGLAAEAVGASMVRAANRAADPPPGAPGIGPGLWQTVTCRPGEDGRLAWWWMWAGPTRDAPPEYELLGPADDVRTAADRIARVLRLRDDAPADADAEVTGAAEAPAG